MLSNLTASVSTKIKYAAITMFPRSHLEEVPALWLPAQVAPKKQKPDVLKRPPTSFRTDISLVH